MCQTKPGPRCSTDTAREWNHVNNKLTDLNQELHNAVEHKNQALRYHLHYDNADSRKLLDGWEERVKDLEIAHARLTTRNREAEYAFNASPQGLERLKKKYKMTAGRTKQFATGFFTEDGDWAEVRYPEYLNTRTTFLLQQAEAHRQRQITARAYVDRPTKTEKYAAAHQLITQATSEKNAVEYSLANSREEEDRLTKKCYETRNETSHITALIAVKRSIALAEIKQTYLNLYLNDLNQFLKINSLEPIPIPQK